MAGVTKDIVLNKLILLFIFDRMEMPLSEDTIQVLCQEKNDWIDYIDWKLALEQLIEADFVCVLPNEAKKAMYGITVEGRVCLAHFFVRIPSSVREMIDNYIKANRMKYRRSQEYNSSYTKRDDGTYLVTLRIIDNLQVVLEIKMTVPNRNQALYIDKTWGEKAPKGYAQLYDLLVEQ